ncbi:expressed unknown protein [Seminavis robusta]|uniref:GxGYxYP putative glycoside hydrolase C-terminal domain-containing protein n=1 Tax=Seminavis robusta TaxID=568900 RepID=A0A9N8D987_9STRA|nr:expressed unknown protein [Seminavis robusta]|eukprot:Sro6_g005020.1 n/a (676) ;mRNA; f:74719-76746
MAPLMRSLLIIVTILLFGSTRAIQLVDIAFLQDHEQISVRACAGLINRPENLGTGIPVYMYEDERDQSWLVDLGMVENDATFLQSLMPAEDFLAHCFQESKRSIIKGYIQFSFPGQLALLPNIITLAGVMDAVPVPVYNSGQPQSGNINFVNLVQESGLPLILDATSEFEGFTALDATRYVFENYGHMTQGGIAKLDPGYLPEERTDDVLPEEFGLFLGEWTPELVPGGSQLRLSDFVIQQRLFAFYLWFGCIQGDPEEQYVSYMTNPNNNPWPNPIPVYGYDRTFTVFQGDFFEANTHCGNNRNMGSIPTQYVTNLSFFNRGAGTPVISSPIVPLAVQDPVYNPDKNYIAVVVGDGDNISFMEDRRVEWMKERVRYCSERPPDQQVLSLANGDPAFQPICYPLSWSMSPHLPTLAPEMWQWYQDSAFNATQGLDTFVLPPSGHLYSYPGLMGSETQAEFVRLTEQDARTLNTNTMVAWEWVGTWNNAFTNYFPKYTNNGVIESVLAMNVPYMFPFVTYPFLDNTYRIIGGNLVVFNTMVWRGVDNRDEFHASADQMANRISNFPRGYINFIYTSSDGGLELDDIHDMMLLLDDHVAVVDSSQMASLAKQKGNPPDLGQDILDELQNLPEVLLGDNAQDLPDILNGFIDGIFRTSESKEQPKGGLRHSNPDMFGF